MFSHDSNSTPLLVESPLGVDSTQTPTVNTGSVWVRMVRLGLELKILILLRNNTNEGLLLVLLLFVLTKFTRKKWDVLHGL